MPGREYDAADGRQYHVTFKLSAGTQVSLGLGVNFVERCASRARAAPRPCVEGPPDNAEEGRGGGAEDPSAKLGLPRMATEMHRRVRGWMRLPSVLISDHVLS